MALNFSRDLNAMEPMVTMRRNPEILALAGLMLVPGAADATDADASAASEANLETLAEAEHVGRMLQKIRNFWATAAVREDGRKRHDALVPYGQLSAASQDMDRGNVHDMVALAHRAGFGVRIVERTENFGR